MDKKLANIAASVKQRLSNIARAQGQVFDVVLVRFALERLLYRLSISDCPSSEHLAQLAA